MVYFIIKNLKPRKKSIKHDYIQLELFFIKPKKETISYKLKLFKDVIIYFILCILLLEILYTKISI